MRMPMVLWLWVAAFIVALGTVYILWPSPARQGASERQDPPGEERERGSGCAHSHTVTSSLVRGHGFPLRATPCHFPD